MVAVKGKANVSGKIEEFSFMVKQAPEIAGQRLDMVMEVNISLVVEFQRWWVLKSKIFAMW